MADIMYYLNSGLDMKNSIIKALPARKISYIVDQDIENQLDVTNREPNFKKNTFRTGSNVQKSLTQSANFTIKNLSGKSNYISK